LAKIKAGVLGCTGAVGQKFVALLNNHPYFEVTELAASENSAGKAYKDAVNWKEAEGIPAYAENMTVKACKPGLDCKIVFSALDSKVAGEIEKEFARAGYTVISNSKNHRMDEDVPLVIPEVNSTHLKLLDRQKGKYGNGCIITNPNCSTIVLAIALSALKEFEVKRVLVTTMQAISGAGYPGVPSLDIMGNVIPYIEEEEEKMERETLKILGTFNKGKIDNADFRISASCNRVPVQNGHLMSVSVELGKEAGKEEIINAFKNASTFDLPSSPRALINYTLHLNRPQPMLDVNSERGMTITIGRLRKCNILQWKFTALGHNTIRGAAGAAILNAEYLVKNNLLQ
jgi:aspartate-semialdehyde dehydrogenase